MKPESSIDINAEVEKLRIQYEALSKKKKEEEERRRAKVRDATSTQMRLYEEGKLKLLTERSKEIQSVRDSSASRRHPSPIPICERLYEEGMNKLTAEKMAEKKLEEKEQLRQLKLRNPTPSPICERLYEEGMQKVLSEKMEMARKEASNSRRRRSAPSPIPICNRLYEEGLAKLKAEKEKMRLAQE